jgi:hypothetical protein
MWRSNNTHTADILLNTLDGDGDFRDGGSAVDKGYSTKNIDRTGLVPTESMLSSESELLLGSEVASEVTTRRIFSWLRIYGWPIAERGIHTHEWFDFGASDQDSDSGSDAGDDQEGLFKRIGE